MAAPHIAGMAALLLQSNPNYTVEQLETILLEGVEDLGKTVRTMYLVKAGQMLRQA